MANKPAATLALQDLQVGTLTLTSGSVLDVTFLGPHNSAIEFYYTITPQASQPSPEAPVLGLTPATSGATAWTLVTQAGSASGLPPGSAGLQQIGRLGDPSGSIQDDSVGVVTFFAKSIKDGKDVELSIENSETDPNTFSLSSEKFNASVKVVLPPQELEIFTTDLTIGSDSLVGLDFEAATNGPTASVRTVTLSGELVREAAYDNIIGLYMANRSGDVVDPLTGLPVKKGAWSAPILDYQQAVVKHDVWSASIADLSTGVVEASFELGAAVDLSNYVLLPYLVANGSSLTASEAEKAFYLGGTSKNADGLVHTRLMGLNTLGFEDLAGKGDFDFDDNILSITSLAVSNPLLSVPA
jgi:hypothetical protein